MKRLAFLYLMILAFGSVQYCYSQDVIHKKNGEVLQVQIIATSNTDITYMTKTKSNNDTLVTIDKNEITSFRRANENTESAEKKELTEEEKLALFEEGKMDADIYYTRYKRPGTLVLVTSLISPIIGLVPAIVSSATPVRDQNKCYPQSKKPRTEEYYSGYAMRAKKNKQRVVWRNWGIALGVNFFAAVLLYSKP